MSAADILAEKLINGAPLEVANSPTERFLLLRTRGEQVLVALSHIADMRPDHIATVPHVRNAAGADVSTIFRTKAGGTITVNIPFSEALSYIRGIAYVTEIPPKAGA